MQERKSTGFNISDPESTMSNEELLTSELFFEAMVRYVADKGEYTIEQSLVLPVIQTLTGDRKTPWCVYDGLVFTNAKIKALFEHEIAHFKKHEYCDYDFESYSQAMHQILDELPEINYTHLEGKPPFPALARALDDLPDEFFIPGLCELTRIYNWLTDYYNDECITSNANIDYVAVDRICEGRDNITHHIFERDSFGPMVAGFKIKNKDGSKTTVIAV